MIHLTDLTMVPQHYCLLHLPRQAWLLLNFGLELELRKLRKPSNWLGSAPLTLHWDTGESLGGGDKINEKLSLVSCLQNNNMFKKPISQKNIKCSGFRKENIWMKQLFWQSAVSFNDNPRIFCEYFEFLETFCSFCGWLRNIGCGWLNQM